MVDKVVDMAVIHKITQLTDAVQYLQEQYGKLCECSGRDAGEIFELQNRVKVLEAGLGAQQKRADRHLRYNHILQDLE